MADDVSVGDTAGHALSDNDYLRRLGVQPRFKRALGFVTGSLFAVAFQGPDYRRAAHHGRNAGVRRPRLHLGDPDHLPFPAPRSHFVWAELSSHYPLTGGIYQWGRQLGGAFVGWMTGLFYVVAIVLVMPAVGYRDEHRAVWAVLQHSP